MSFPRATPDLHAHFLACCQRLGMSSQPAAYVLNGNGVLNAFATKFLRAKFVVLNSGVVDALESRREAVRFYMGHELGHLRMKHLQGRRLRLPALWLPLLGAAYSRARESTCDRHGAACCDSGEEAVRALSVLAAGESRWKDLNLASYTRQAEHGRGFWMSLHELLAGYPWLVKRALRVMGDGTPVPRRHPLAWIPALFFPYAGRLGSGFGLLILVYIIGIIAAIAIPAYQAYTVRARLELTLQRVAPIERRLGEFYESRHVVPESLAAVGIAARLDDGTELSLDSAHMQLSASTPYGELLFTPLLDNAGNVRWRCSGGQGAKPAQLPPECR